MWGKSALAGVLMVGFLAGDVLAKPSSAPPSAPASRYASIVVEFDTGKVLYERNADFSRYPASLTKIMTLYLAFESLKAGKIKLDQPMRVSEYAAGRDPSKLGLTPGGTLTVEQAIRGMTTKSANDAASVLAEHIGGCESSFAEAMTAKGKALGMAQTTFYNASGLPSAGHISSARDLSVLARALIRDYPEYYHYFSLGDFEYRGKHWGNQNRFLRTYFGADGIKTGFIYSSGHNLAASALRGPGKRLIAIVLGGDTAGWTREHASRLMDIAYSSIDPALVVMAQAKPERAPMAEVGEEDSQVAAPVLAAATGGVPVLPSEQTAGAAPDPTIEQPPAVNSPSPATAMLLTAAASDGQDKKDKPRTKDLPQFDEVVAEMQLRVPAGVAPTQAAAAQPTAKVAATAAAPAPAAQAAAKVAGTAAPAPATTVTAATAKPAVVAAAAPAAKPAAIEPPVVAAPTPAKAASTAQAQAPAAAPASAVAPAILASRPDPEEDASLEQGDGPAAAPSPAASTNAPEGWSVQVGVFRDASVAKQRGEEVRGKMPVQLRASTLIVDAIGDGVHVSSRFVMSNERDARQACTDLQRGRVPCVVIPPGRPLVVSAN